MVWTGNSRCRPLDMSLHDNVTASSTAEPTTTVRTPPITATARTRASRARPLEVARAMGSAFSVRITAPIRRAISPEHVRLGEACTPGACAVFSYCDPANNTCKSVPGIGEACSSIGAADGGDYADCLTGWCSVEPGQAEGTCQPFKSVGDACSGDGECGQSFGGCSLTTHTCVAWCVEQ